MPRGGQRPGAGRKPTVSYRDKIGIGADCERLWREACECAEQTAVAEATIHVRDQWEKAQAVPVGKRKKWIQEEYDLHRSDVEIDLQTDQGLADDEVPARVLTIMPKRPKGLRDQIIEQVAVERSISTRMVETSWKEFRRLEKQLEREPED